MILAGRKVNAFVATGNRRGTERSLIAMRFTR